MVEAGSPPRSGRRDPTYVPTVLLGLAGAGLAAVAGSRDWATVTADSAGVRVEASVTGAESQPLVAALSLVALAAWGVVLVVRGTPRRFVAAAGVLAAAAVLVNVVLAFDAVQDDALEAAAMRGATGEVFDSGLTAWYYLTDLGAVITLVAFTAAVVRSPRWPAMGTRYDAPAGRAASVGDEDLWRALDEGRDPTS
jgi:uncharacterized membrane protein (TIGR02234 family)